MKTRDEVVDKALSDFKTKHASDDNWLKSRVMGAWNSGYTSGKKDGYAIGFEEGFNIADVNISKEDAYRSGYKDGYDEHDVVWKEKHELLDELKQQEYQRGLNDLWYAIRQLELSPADGALSVDEIEKIFGTSFVYSILQNVHPENVIDKIRAYEEQQKANGTNVLTNAQKFAEIFPNVVPFNDSSWWDEPYKEHGNGMA